MASASLEGGTFREVEKHEFCEIQATVTTGFENIAKEEADEKLNVVSKTEHGHIAYKTAIEEAHRSLELTTVENLYTIIERYPDFKFKENKEDDLNQLRDLVPNVDWALGLKVWKRFSNYPHEVSPLPQPTQTTNNENSEIQTDTTNKNTDSNPVKTNNSSSAKTDGDTGKIDDGKTNVTLTVQPETCLDSDPSEEPKAKVRRTCHGFPDLPSFRVTCYRSNGKHSFSSMEAASQFGSRVQDHFGWNVSMKDFDIEVVLFVNGSHVYIGIALTKESLHRRHISYLGPTPLKPTIACGMLRFCQIQPGESVCDPMCGGGTIPIQAATFWPQSQHICGELHDMAVDRSMMNIEAVNDKRRKTGRPPMNVDVVKWDTTTLPLKDKSIDVFVTDLPFGKRSGSKMRNWHLYPRVLIEMARVAKHESGRACLLTQDKKCMTKTMQIVSEYWRRGSTLWINIGGLAAGVYMLHRTSKAYNEQSTRNMLQKAN